MRGARELRKTITEVMENIADLTPDAERFIRAYERITYEFPEQQKIISLQPKREAREAGRTFYCLLQDLIEQEPHLAPVIVQEIHEEVFRRRRRQVS
jgi:hypothetical protein